LQKGARGDARTDIIMITHETREKNVDAAIERIEQLASVVGKVIRIRLETLS
ncbi:homoserine dehydrogenase, partial [Acinetobacter baumannii]|nr:homoserine dehydrogenase [Acinetobacter baumannii]